MQAIENLHRSGRATHLLGNFGRRHKICMTLSLCLFHRHEELIAKGGHYAEMWQQQLQAKQSEVEEGANGSAEIGKLD